MRNDAGGESVFSGLEKNDKPDADGVPVSDRDHHALDSPVFRVGDY